MLWNIESLMNFGKSKEITIAYFYKDTLLIDNMNEKEISIKEIMW